MSEEVAEQIKKNIASGILKPGDKLPSVRLLSESFQVGQSTIREAFSILKTIGLIETRQGEGTFVREYHPAMLHQPISDFLLFSKRDIIDLLDVRKILERGTVALAAARRNKQDLEEMAQIIKEMELDLHSDNFGETADWKFHFAIAKASRNRILISLIEELSVKIKKGLKASRMQMYLTPGMPERLLAEHRSIFMAIERQAIKEAERKMVDHLTGVQEYIITASQFELEEES